VASKADYVAALSRVMYANAADEPSGGARLAVVVANDGERTSRPVRVTIALRPRNDEPRLAFALAGAPTETTTSLPEGAVVAVFPAALVADDDAGDVVTRITVTLGRAESATGEHLVLAGELPAGAEMDAALNGFPNPPAGPRRVNVEIPR
jgi:hypothetical protein